MVLEKCTKIHHAPSVLLNHNVSQCLKNLKNKYIITPIDKATGNVAFICKRYYAKVLISELGLNDISIPVPEVQKTYVKVNNMTKDQILNEHKSDLKRLFGLEIKDDNMVLPNMPPCRVWTLEE
jgi:glutamate formiminotransferase